MVFREQHPLNKGKRSSELTGLAGKKYARCDWAGPIIDDLVMFHAHLGWCPHLGWCRLPAQEDAASGARSISRLEKQVNEFGFAPSAKEERQPLCKMCGTFDANDFQPTKDKDAWLCKCGSVSGSIFKSMHREKNCAEDEDKTQHADRPFEQKADRFDKPALSAEEARKEREREHRAGFIGKRTKSKLGLGFAPENCARDAARAERERQEMAPRDKTKELQILTKLEELFDGIEPLDPKIKRYCRVQAYTAWRRAVKHVAICKATSRCQLNIKSRGPPVIAESTLVCALQRLQQGIETVEGINHCTVLALNDKVAIKSRVNASSASHRAVRTQVANLLAHADPEAAIESCPVPSAECSPAPSRAESEASGGSPLLRGDSFDSEADGDMKAQVIQLRNSVGTIFRMLGAQMPISAHQSALVALAAPEFRAALALQREGGGPLAALSMQALSFVILEAVAREQEAGGGCSRPAASPKLIQSLGLEAAQVQPAVAALRAILPDAAVQASAAEPEDGLF
jgi:hypothetical protein